MKNDFIKYSVITTYDERWKLSALLSDEGKYSMVSLEADEEYIDNQDYILNIPLPCLKGERPHKEIADIVTLDDFEEVRGIIEEGIKMKFFDKEDK